MQIKDQVVTVIRNQIADVEMKLTEAKVKLAETFLNEEEWQIRAKFEKLCKVYEGQIRILENIENVLEKDVFVISLPART